MSWYNEEQLEAARQMTAMEYLQKYQPYRLKKASARNEWELTDHDSFKINGITSKWPVSYTHLTLPTTSNV